MILADIEPTPGGYWQFCLIVAFISSVAVNVVTIVVLLANRKERREVSFAFEPASKAEFDEHKRRTEMAFAEIRQELRRDRDDILTAGTSRAQAILRITSDKSAKSFPKASKTSLTKSSPS